jgi:predicted tellurium resistance membrane protein TerC
MEWITSPEAWIALTTLTFLEIVLGVDNIIFISIPSDACPKSSAAGACSASFAMGTRILLRRLPGSGGSGVLFPWRHRTPAATSSIGGGLFLLAKATLEIHDSLEGEEGQDGQAPKHSGFVSVIIQIGLIDIVFSLDSVITAVGLVDQLAVMIIAIVIAVGVMMFAAAAIGRFVDDHPTIKMLALSFLVLIGVALIGEGVDVHIPKGYIYFAMAFSVGVEMLNLKVRRGRPVHLKKKDV